MRERQPVRLGKHGSEYIFERAAGLHESATGIAVVGFGADDPEIIFEEHGLGRRCEYFELLDGDPEFDEELGPDTARPDIAEQVKSDHWPTKCSALQAAFSLEPPARVNSILKTVRREWASRGGGVFLVKTTGRLQRRKAMIRTLHAAQAQPDRRLDDLLGEPQPLEEHSAGNDGLHHYLYSPAVLLASPSVRGFTASRVVAEVSVTYTLVVLSEPGMALPPGPGEIGWETVFHDGLPALRNRELAGASWVTELNAPAAAISPRTLIEWWTRQLNELFTEITDLGRYRADDGRLDARNAYRELRTLERIIGNCVRIQANVEDHVGRVSAAFEFFDLLPNLLPRPVKPQRVWSSLADPQKALDRLRAAFASSPEPICRILVERAERVTATLRAETMETVVPGRIRDGGVVVDGLSGTLPPDVYVPKLLHQLRNTHHGYELQNRNQRAVLDTHTGHISVALPELVVLYVVAMLSDPSAALDGAWI